LIRQGAKLVETAEDVLEDLGSLSLAAIDIEGAASKSSVAKVPALEKEYVKLLEKIAFDPTSVDQLVAETDFTVDEISSMLLVLELQGLVSSAPGGLFYRCAANN